MRCLGAECKSQRLSLAELFTFTSGARVARVFIASSSTFVQRLRVGHSSHALEALRAGAIVRSIQVDHTLETIRPMTQAYRAQSLMTHTLNIINMIHKGSQNVETRLANVLHLPERLVPPLQGQPLKQVACF